MAFYSQGSNLVPDDTNSEVDVFVRDLAAGTTERVSVSSDGQQQDGGALSYHAGNDSYARPAISFSGRYVAFVSSAPTLRPPIADGEWHVYVHDRETRRTDWIAPISFDESPAMSDDGRTLVFMHPSAEPGGQRIAIYDAETQDLKLLDIYEEFEAPAPFSAGTAVPTNPSVSGDGSTLTFTLGTALGTNARHIYAYDRGTGEVELVSTPDPSFVSEGPEPDLSHSQLSTNCTLSDVNKDGRFVAFTCATNNLVAGDVSAREYAETYVRDRLRGTTERVSVTTFAEEPWDMPSVSDARPAISADGRLVAFVSRDKDLAPGSSGSWALFTYDRVLGAVERISMTPEGHPSAGTFMGPDMDASGREIVFAANGAEVPENGTAFTLEDLTRHMWVYNGSPQVGVGPTVARSSAGTIELHGWASLGGKVIANRQDLEGDGYPLERADLSRFSLTYRPELADLLFSTDAVTVPVRQYEAACQSGSPYDSACVKVVGNPSTVFGFRFEARGLAYEVRISGPSSRRRGVDEGTTGAGVGAKVQVERIDLFRCDANPCSLVQPVRGGYATRRADLTASVPLDLIGVGEGDRLQHVSAFSGTGTAGSGVAPDAYFLGVGPRDEIAITEDVLIPTSSITVQAPTIPETKATVVGDRFTATVPAPATAVETVNVTACIGVTCTTRGVAIN